MRHDSRRASTIPHIKGAQHNAEGVVIEFSDGTQVFYQTDLLWDLRSYEGNVPGDLLCGSIDVPAQIN